MFLFILISGSRIAQKIVASASNNIVCFFHFLVTQAMVHYVFKNKIKKRSYGALILQDGVPLTANGAQLDETSISTCLLGFLRIKKLKMTTSQQ